eukprot:3339645-Ditylum_brightwellii.AAC.1
MASLLVGWLAFIAVQFLIACVADDAFHAFIACGEGEVVESLIACMSQSCSLIVSLILSLTNAF